MNNMFLSIYLPKKKEENNKNYKYSQGIFINNIDYGSNNNSKTSNNDANFYRIPLQIKELPPIEFFERYNQTNYILLKFEILEFNDFINLYQKRINKNYTIPNFNLENNIAKKYINIKELEISMK
jgi:hypothetical protein